MWLVPIAEPPLLSIVIFFRRLSHLVYRGQQVFEAKLCASCHEQVDTGAPNLAAKAGQFSAFSMVSALWQHGGGMLSRMVAQNKQWQVLSAQEMADIIAYLNTGR